LTSSAASQTTEVVREARVREYVDQAPVEGHQPRRPIESHDEVPDEIDRRHLELAYDTVTPKTWARIAKRIPDYLWDDPVCRGQMLVIEAAAGEYVDHRFRKDRSKNLFEYLPEALETSARYRHTGHIRDLLRMLGPVSDKVIISTARALALHGADSFAVELLEINFGTEAVSPILHRSITAHDLAKSILQGHTRAFLPIFTIIEDTEKFSHHDLRAILRAATRAQASAIVIHVLDKIARCLEATELVAAWKAIIEANAADDPQFIGEVVGELSYAYAEIQAFHLLEMTLARGQLETAFWLANFALYTRDEVQSIIQRLIEAKGFEHWVSNALALRERDHPDERPEHLTRRTWIVEGGILSARFNRPIPSQAPKPSTVIYTEEPLEIRRQARASILAGSSTRAKRHSSAGPSEMVQ
jgi:hypothetical protein